DNRPFIRFPSIIYMISGVFKHDNSIDNSRNFAQILPNGTHKKKGNHYADPSPSLRPASQLDADFLPSPIPFLTTELIYAFA
ncbi:hypothetical protein, partial [Pseudomonas sp. PA-5-4G]|uniref:hypothetical protein n=3 Tax=unclassified Pseudomonas TaxID=196821 RepID=UPI001F174CC4